MLFFVIFAFFKIIFISRKIIYQNKNKSRKPLFGFLKLFYDIQSSVNHADTVKLSGQFNHLNEYVSRNEYLYIFNSHDK